MAKLLVLAVLAALLYDASAKHGSFTKVTVNAVDGSVESPQVALDITEERKRNPCIMKKCQRGETCVLDRNLQATCVCREDCSFYVRHNERYKACSNKNDTYETECHLDRDHCLCKKDKKGCSRPGVTRIQLDHYGACQADRPCNVDQKEQFPIRMRNWFLVLMQDMDKRSEIGEYHELLNEAEKDPNHSYAVVWKFCDFDTDPQDRLVSRRELQYTVRSLLTLEDCLLPFLDDCDADDDRQISLVEWGHCLGLEEVKITDKCHKIHKNKEVSQ